MQMKCHLNVFTLALMNVAIIMSLRGLPLMAKEGMSLIFYLIESLIFFLIPSALISAELASSTKEEGGILRWVTEAFGERWGFTAIFLQWIQNLFWYPTILAFAAGALSYLFLMPELASSKTYNMLFVLIVYWGATLVSLNGMKASGYLSSIGAFVGTLVPAAFIILLGLMWWLQGNPLFFSLKDPLLPNFNHFSNLALMGGIVLLFAGMEVNAVHIKEVKNPTKTYPKAIFLSAIVIFVIFLLGSLSIGAVLPPDEISLTAGVMQAFSKFLALYQISWLLPILSLLIVFGAVGGIAAWIVGPSKGILHAAEMGLIPPFLSHVNRHHAPRNILLIQGLIVTILSQVYLIMPTVNSAFFLLTDLTVMLYLIMYLLMYCTFLYLRIKKPQKQRPFKVPGGLFGMYLTAGIGILGALFALLVGFFPPYQLGDINGSFYTGFIVTGLLITLGAAQAIVSFKKPKWKKHK